MDMDTSGAMAMVQIIMRCVGVGSTVATEGAGVAVAEPILTFSHR